MKPYAYIVINLLLVVSFVSSSEFHITLDEKVKNSSIIVVGDVSEVELGDINKEGQLTTIVFSVDVVLKGEVGKEIRISPRSVSYQIGNTVHGSTAGWSNYGINKGNKYILYLTKQKEVLALIYNSNQFMERVHIDKNQVNDVGQTLTTVPYDQKLLSIRQLIGENK